MAWHPTRGDDFIDSFDDQNLDEYTAESGTKSDWSFTQTTTQGTHAITGSGSSRLRLRSFSGDGLDNYPSRGDDWSFDYRQDGSSAGRPHHEFFMGSTSPSDNRYFLELKFDSNEVDLDVWNGGSSTELFSQAASLPENEYMEVRINTSDTANNTIQVVITDGSGGGVLDHSVTDSTHDSGGIGWAHNAVSTPSQSYYDNARLR